MATSIECMTGFPGGLAAALFASVGLGLLSAQTAPVPRYSSTIVIYDVNTKAATVVHRAEGIWEAPNWSRDGRFLLSNSSGKLYRISVAGGSPPEPVNLEPARIKILRFFREGKCCESRRPMVRAPPTHLPTRPRQR